MYGKRIVVQIHRRPDLGSGGTGRRGLAAGRSRTPAGAERPVVRPQYHPRQRTPSRRPADARRTSAMAPPASRAPLHAGRCRPAAARGNAVRLPERRHREDGQSVSLDCRPRGTARGHHVAGRHDRLPERRGTAGIPAAVRQDPAGEALRRSDVRRGPRRGAPVRRGDLRLQRRGAGNEIQRRGRRSCPRILHGPAAAGSA